MNTVSSEALLLDESSGDGHILRDEQTFIGREPSCQVCLSNDTVSKRHAVIARKEDGWYLMDLGSSNGVTLNGCPIIPQLHYKLQNGAVVGFADAVAFRFTDRESDIRRYYMLRAAADQTIEKQPSVMSASETAPRPHNDQRREERRPYAPSDEAPAPVKSREPAATVPDASAPRKPESPVLQREQNIPSKKRGARVWVAIVTVAAIGIFCAAFFLTEGFKSKQVRSLEDSIDAIGEVTLSSDEAIRSAREEYDRLSENDRNRVNNLAALENAETVYQTLSDKDTAERFDEELGQLGEITLDSGDTITALRNRFDSLSAGVKSYVTKESLLTAAEERYWELVYDQRAAEIDETIFNLGEISLSSENKLLEVRQTVDDLQQEVKSRLSNLELLVQKEQELEALKEKNAYDQVVLAAKSAEGRSAIDAALGFLSSYPTSSYQSKVEALCENAYTQYAKSLENQKRWEEAQHVLEECVDQDFSTSNGAAKTALDRLMNRIGAMQPVNGRVLGGNCRGGYCQLIIENGVSDVLVKIQSVQDPEKTYLLFYVRANETAKVNIRDGTYTIKYATGDTWYGEDALFGENTRYTILDTTFTMETKYSGYTVNYTEMTYTLYGVVGGNTSSSDIDENDF